ncbi:hypothetical protein [Methanogenium organophilum]|uniref:Uncharacterized protein n=1 Tax=Methanogenium organophilum TaxID=2199 RepID=A0A9X9T8H7_METOG|nr:hypothetical protein [Methanogenium organophilum]WAI01705.1 hypothetical protein OU421_02200 [Methanogenium organophilum]
MMAGFDDYMNSYLDRRMKHIIDEWNLGTMRDFGDYHIRLQSVESEITKMRRFTEIAGSKLTNMEERAEKVREEKQ